MQRSPRWIATLVAFGLASVVNPGYFSGCVSGADGGPEKFDFGEAELLDLVDSAAGPYEIQQANETYRVEVSLAQSEGEDSDDTIRAQLDLRLYSRAAACGNRSFMQSASACITTTTVPLMARVSVYKRESNTETEILHERELEGTLWVAGTTLTAAQITLSGGTNESLIQVTLNSADAKSFELTQFKARAGDTIF